MLSDWLTRHVGPPLYHCEACGTAARLRGGSVVKRCDCAAKIIAPRKVFLYGATGEPSLRFRLMVKAHQIASAITGRCV